jgi:hypothetical protein
MDRLRLLLRLLTFLLGTVAFGFLLWTLVVMVGVLVFDSPTPECRTNDTCNAFGDIVYPVQESWLARLAWFSLSGLLLVWPFLWVNRSHRPIPQQPQVSKR